MDSYLDGTAITPQGKDGEDALESKNEKIHLAQGETVIYNKGRQLQISGAEEPPARLAWDRWVLARVEQKRVETAAALKASGLSSSFSGLTHLYEEGTFFQCAQHGTCWRPRPTQQPATVRRPIIIVREYPLFCSRESLRVESVVDPKTGKKKVIRQTIVPNFWDLEVCPFEICPEISTIRYSSNQYALLVKPANALSRKRGKLPVPPRMRRGDAVRWVRVGDRVGLVLRNLVDERGKPRNLKYGVFLLPSKPGGVVEQVALNSSEKVKKLPKPPKEFQAEFTPAPRRAAAPEIQVHFMIEAASGTADGTNPNVRTAALRITYDYETRNFVAASAVASGWTSKAVVIAKLSSRGGFSCVEGSRSYGNNGGSLGTQSSGASSFRSAGAQAWSSGGGTANSSSSGASTGSATTAKSGIPRQN